MKTNRKSTPNYFILALFFLSLAILACGGTSGSKDVNGDAAATAVQQTAQAAAQSGDASSGLQPISPANLTATSVASTNQQAAADTTENQSLPSFTPTTQNLAQQPAPTQASAASDNQQPTAMPTSPPAPTSPPPTSTSPPPPTQGPVQPSSMTSSYVELYDVYSSNVGVDLDNGGGLDEMAYFEYKSSDPNPGHGVGQMGGRGTVWADVGTSAPTYETCTAINAWYPSLFITQGHYYCYITDQQNYGYMRVDRLEQVGTGGSELSPWVLGISFTTWLP